ncbi:MAG: hypothetical protein ACRDMV_05730 [Streptosporangiales bacterium]
MPRIRTIKPGFFRSEDVSTLPLRARLTWIGLWTHCDDQGRTKDNARLIKGDIWPLDDVSLRDIEEDLETLSAHGRIVRYEVDGRCYLAVTNWSDHQRIQKPSPSNIPPPSDLSSSAGTDRSGSATGTVVEDSGTTTGGKGKEGKGKEGSSARKRATKLPEDWQPTERHHSFASEHRLNVDREVFRFRNHAEANDRRQVSWNAAFSTWLDKARDYQSKPTGSEDWRRFAEQ